MSAGARLEPAGAGRWAVHGDLVGATVARLWDDRARMLEPGTGVCLDLRAVASVDSAGVALLVALAGEIRRRGGTLVVESPPPAALSIAGLSGVRSLIDPDREDRPELNVECPPAATRGHPMENIVDPQVIEELIGQGLPGAEVRVEGDGRHFNAVVVSDAFAGKSMIQQHRLVYDTLGARFDRDEVHALSIKTYTPEQWARLQDR